MGLGTEQYEFSIWRDVEIFWRRHPALRPLRKAFRAAKRFLPDYWRLATHQYRQLPSTVIVGAQKAGTTQLFSSLVRHPRCWSGATKELQYFSKHRSRPVRWYRSQFPLAATLARAKGICLEATPSYLPSPQGLRMMAQVLPAAKIIVLLRDPVARAFSHYQHYRSRRLETRSFPEVVHASIERRMYEPSHGAAMNPNAEPLLDYVDRGYYALQLEVLFDVYDREQVLIIDSADLFDDTNAICQEVFDTLGLERHDVTPKKIHNRGYYREGIDPATSQLLRSHYKPHDQLLVDLLGRRFRWMDASGQSDCKPSAAA